MMRRVGTVATFLSTLFFPWPLTAVLALGVSIFEPLVPAAAGIFMDTLYYTGGQHSLPIFAISGVVVTVAAYFVRSRLKTGIIEG